MCLIFVLGLTVQKYFYFENFPNYGTCQTITDMIHLFSSLFVSFISDSSVCLFSTNVYVPILFDDTTVCLLLSIHLLPIARIPWWSREMSVSVLSSGAPVPKCGMCVTVHHNYTVKNVHEQLVCAWVRVLKFIHFWSLPLCVEIPIIEGWL